MLDFTRLKKVKKEDKLYPLVNRCFAKSGVTVFAGASGSGKSVYLQEFCETLKNMSYNVWYFNADMSPMGMDTFEPLPLSDFISLLQNGNSNDVVIIDTLKAYWGFNSTEIDDDAESYKIMEEFTKVSREVGVTIILVHHTKPDGSLEGSTSIFEGADTVTIFERDGEQMRGVVKKQRYGFDEECIVTLNEGKCDATN